MHEYALIKEVIGTILEKWPRGRDGAAGRPAAESVVEVILTVGALEMHSEESFRQSFAALSRGTPLEKSRLTLVVAPAVFECGQCGRRRSCPEGSMDPHDPVLQEPCPACGGLARLAAGWGVEAMELIVAPALISR